MASTRIFQRVLAFLCLVVLASEAAVLPADEVESLKIIARTLGKTNWDFEVDPCSNSSGWVTPNPIKGSESAVSCNCEYENGTICHVTSIILKSQNLNGSLPPELVRLPFLQELDLSRNYLGGSIPQEWGAMKLIHISLLGNRLAGSIPKELANISKLTELVLESNQLSGSIPVQFGDLRLIDRLLLSSNNLTGQLPETLANLTTLKDFGISDNNFTGNIPAFIQNWVGIEKIAMQSSGLSGPIPSGIASLINLADLRISGLNGNESKIPSLRSTRLDTLILRSCNIVDQLPSYIGGFTHLDVLDLSFNKLSGPIPENFIGLSKTHYIYLTGNSLSGPVPAWMLSNGDNIDLSYNSFTSGSSEPSCQPRTPLNLFASTKGNTSGVVSCLKVSQCQQHYYSLQINCGGSQMQDENGIAYEDDKNADGPSKFYQSKTNWATSSTGHFLDDEISADTYAVRNTSRIVGQNSQLYTDARISPLSLSYYGFCLRNGRYRVDLHFAEIVFTDDRTFRSLGRRIFDVYIQGRRMLKDFDIAADAGGANKAIIKNFTVNVTDGTLDIRFYWPGKGTTAIPDRGVYGPLISAIYAVNLGKS